MKKLFNILTFTVITALIIILILFYFGAFSPLRDELGKTLIEDFKSTVSINEINVENYISRCRQGAESLSSRTMIKNKLYEYQKGRLKFEQLKDYTQPKYVDGARVLDHVIAAVRFTNDRTVAVFNHPAKQFTLNFQKYNNETKSTDINIQCNKKIIIISSPIEYKGRNLGKDIVIFNIAPLIEQLNEKRIHYRIIEKNKISDKFIDNKNEVINYRQILDTNYWLVAQISKAKLYKGLNDLITQIVLGLITAFIIIIVIFGLIINKTYQKVLRQMREKIEKITELSETDYLLKIYNRSKFMEELKAEVSRVKRYGNSFSLIMFDVDKFKVINDKYGHDTGDEVLIKITEVIKEKIREPDIFARYGGDEFIILTPNTELKEALQLANRLRKSVAKADFENLNKVTCSFGVTEFNSQDDIDSVIKKVDDALYKAKRKGRDRVEKKV